MGADGTPRADEPEGNVRAGLLAAWSGVLAAALTLGVGQLVAGIVSPSAAPLVVVGDAVVDRVPAPVKEWAIRSFGTSDKTVLLATTAVLLALSPRARGCSRGAGCAPGWPSSPRSAPWGSSRPPPAPTPPS